MLLGISVKYHYYYLFRTVNCSSKQFISFYCDNRDDVRKDDTDYDNVFDMFCTASPSAVVDYINFISLCGVLAYLFVSIYKGDDG